MVTVEPVMDFDLKTLTKWIKDIKPFLVWLGYDSKRCFDLIEPELSKVKKLKIALTQAGIKVKYKTIREAR